MSVIKHLGTDADIRKHLLGLSEEELQSSRRKLWDSRDEFGMGLIQLTTEHDEVTTPVGETSQSTPFATPGGADVPTPAQSGDRTAGLATPQALGYSF